MGFLQQCAIARARVAQSITPMTNPQGILKEGKKFFQKAKGEWKIVQLWENFCRWFVFLKQGKRVVSESRQERNERRKANTQLKQELASVEKLQLDIYKQIVEGHCSNILDEKVIEKGAKFMIECEVNGPRIQGYQGVRSGNSNEVDQIIFVVESNSGDENESRIVLI